MNWNIELGWPLHRAELRDSDGICRHAVTAHTRLGLWVQMTRVNIAGKRGLL